MQPTDRNLDQRHDNDINQEKEKLERELKQSIRKAEEASASSSTRHPVLGALHNFLTKWDTLELEEIDTQQEYNRTRREESRDLPRDFVRVVFSRLLSNLDPVKSVDTVREQLLSTLRSLQTASCRQVVLNFLPAVTQVFLGTNSSSSAWTEGKSKRAKKQILSCLREVFENEPDSLSQILQFFSSILSDILRRKHVILPRDVFLFVLEALPKVPETYLHVALRALIQYVESSEDARLAVDSIRTELALLEKTDISDMAPVAVVFDEVARGMNKNQELFVEEYFSVVEEILNEGQKEIYRLQPDDDHHVDDVENDLLTFDLVMLIFLGKGSIVHRDRILRIITDGSLLESGLLSGERTARLVELAKDERTCISETRNGILFETKLGTYLLESLVDFSVYILVTPVYCLVEYDTKKFFSKIQVVLIDTVMSLPEEFQTRTVSIALRFFDELMGLDEDVTNDRLHRKGKIRNRICQNIFILLLSLMSRRRDILLPFQNQLVDYIISESLDHFTEVNVLMTLCTTVAKSYCNNDSNGSLYIIAICRGLLFSAQTETKLICRQIRGMVLANAIILSCDLDATLLSAMQKTVSKVLLSPYSTLVMMDPRVGLRGIKNLRCIRKHSKCDHSLGNELFRVMSLLLSHSRIVKYPDGPREQAAAKPNPIFVYSNMPSVFPFGNATGKQVRFRKMIFRFNYFFANEALLNEPSSWERFSVWIFEVVDTYLALGRTAKWNPRAWVFAGIEIPGVPSSSPITVRRKEKLVYWLKNLFSEFGHSQTTKVPASRMDKFISELFKGTKAISEKEDMVNAISRLGLTLLFALSTSIAILCNTYNHFQNFFKEGYDEMESKEKDQALQMLHYQFAKIYDLKRACQAVERLFRGIGSRGHTGARTRSKKTKRRRLSRPSGGTEKTPLQMKAEMIALYMRESMTKLLSSIEYIPEKLFWVCLTDPSHDSFVISAVKTLQKKRTVEPILGIIKLRLDLVKHFATIPFYAAQAATGASAGERPPKYRGSILRCLRLTSFLLLNFPLLKRETESGELIDGLIKLTSEYLRLACSLLISTKVHDEISETSEYDYSHIFDLYLSIFGSKQPLDKADKSAVTCDSFDVKDFDALVSSFQDYICDHHNSITSQLLETLSVFAARSGSKILDRMIDAHWNATFLCKYTNEERETDISGSPFVLAEVLKALLHHKPHGLTNASIEECCSHRIITKMMKHRYNKSLERHQYLIHSTRRHWGLIALSPRRFELITNFLDTLLGKLVNYLRDVDDFFVGQKVDSSDNEVLSDEYDDDDDEYLPPSTNTTIICKSSIPASSDFDCLTSDSYPIYLDMLMRMTVSSVALFSIPEEMSKFKQPRTSSSNRHPVNELERMVIVYGELLKLYKKKIHIFPKILQSSVTNVSKCMLDISVKKSQEYLEWRNSQPVLRFGEGRLREPDLASTEYLKKLLDTFGLHVIGPLREFCSAYSGVKRIQDGETTIQPKNNFTITGLRQLARKNEKTFDFLSQMSNRYGKGEVKTEDTDRHTPQGDNGALMKVSEDCSRTEQSSTMEDSTEKEFGEGPQKETVNEIDSSLIRKRSSRRGSSPTPCSIGKAKDPSYSEDEESLIDDNNDTSSSASDAFGVSGDWGQDSDDSDKEDYDSEFYIDHFQKSS